MEKEEIDLEKSFKEFEAQTKKLTATIDDLIFALKEDPKKKKNGWKNY